MQIFGRLLNRAILSHLLVAVPPAAVLGAMVVDINGRTLRQESQQLHLSVASQLKDALAARVDETSLLLGHAERILDLAALSIDARKDLLRALVADQRLPQLMMYRADGAFDSVIRLEGINDVDRDPLPADFLKRVHEDELGLRPDASGVKVVVPWRKGDETLGYLASRLSADELHELCVETASRYLGTGGIIDVVDIRGNYVLSSVAGRSGTPDRNKTPFSMVKLAGQGGLTALEAGVVGDFNDAEGTARLGAVVSSAHLRWLVGASRPVKTAFASLRRVRLRVLLMSIIAALASGVVGLLMARQISGPVQRLVRSVRRAAKRGFTPETKVAASGELGQLASAFNHALSQMDQYRRQIRRTTQLRLRLARLAPDSASARELLARASTEIPSSPPQPMAVLYADVIFEDPKDTNSDHLVTILGEFFSAAHEAVRQEGGRVDQFSGDAVIGLFTSEQLKGDGEAVAAALAAARSIIADAKAIRERWNELSSIRLSASVGVVFGAAQLLQADDPGMDPTVHGDLVDRAAALQNQAKGGVILVDPVVAARSPKTLTAVDGLGEPAYPWPTD